jgi:hypothetical protein
MTALRRLQQDFQSYLLDGDAAVEAQVVDAPPAPATDRLAVYGHAYGARLIEALGKDFPALKALLGDDPFHAMGDAYVAAHPSRHPSLRWFGRHLAGFLRGAESYRDRPQLAEMADFEWAQGEVFDGPDVPPVTLEAMAAIPAEHWAELKLSFQPTLRRLELYWNMPTLLQAVQKQQPVPEPQRSEAPATWLLWRRDLLIYWRSLPEDERQGLELCQRGGSFGELCEFLSGRMPAEEAPARAASLLKQWITDGLVCSINLD